MKVLVLLKVWQYKVIDSAALTLPNGNRLHTSPKHNTNSGEVRYWLHCYLQCWWELFASSSHHTVQSHWVLRNINIHSSHRQQPRVFVLGAPRNAWIQSLWFTHCHLHHSPEKQSPLLRKRNTNSNENNCSIIVLSTTIVSAFPSTFKPYV
jgi:hypothetical protein